MRARAQILLAALLLVSSAPYPGQAATGADGFGPPSVRVEDGKLSVSLVDASAREALEMVGRQSGIRIVFYGDVGTWSLTVSFDGLPLEQGLRRLLHGTSHVFVYEAGEPDRRLSRVFVMPSVSDGSKGSSDDGGEQLIARGGAEALSEALSASGIRKQLEEAIILFGATTSADQLGQGVAEPVFNRVLRDLLAVQPTDGRSAPDSRGVLDPVDARLEELLKNGPARQD